MGKEPTLVTAASINAETRGDDGQELSPAERIRQPGCYFPQRVLMGVLMWMALMIGYMHRVVLSVAVITISEKYHWDSTTKGFVLSSFFWGYLITNVPSGFLATKIGGKLVLGLGLAGGSVFTIIFPFAVRSSFPLLIGCRVMTGLCEAVLFPSVHNLISRWIPKGEVTRAVGWIWSGSNIGIIVGMVATQPVIDAFGWEVVFYGSGVVGLIWFALWMILASSTPQDSTFITFYEREYITTNAGAKKEENVSVPWVKIFTCVPFYATILGHFAANWGGYILLTWLPTYFEDDLHFDYKSAGLIVSFLPYFMPLPVQLIVSRLADYVVTSGKRKDVDEAQLLLGKDDALKPIFGIHRVTFVRKLFQTIGLMAPAICLALQCRPYKAWISFSLMIVGQSLSTFTTGGFASNHMDIGPKYAGILYGITNLVATIPGIVGVTLTGYMLTTTSWCAVFILASGVYTFGTIVFLVIGTGKKCID